MIYFTQGKYTPKFLNPWVFGYVRTFFHQDWKLFAPDPPKCHIALWIKEGNTWQWAGKELLEKHHAYRVTAHGIAYRAYQALARDLLYSYEYCQTSYPSDVTMLKQCFKQSFAAKKATEFIKRNENRIFNDSLRLRYACMALEGKADRLVPLESDYVLDFPVLSSRY